MTRFIKHLQAACLAGAMSLAVTAQATPDDDARVAYDKGDYAAAFAIWSELASQNDARAQYALGVMHTTGNGAEKDPARAFEWFRKAAESGHVKAMYNLGIAYWTGAGVGEDRAQGVHWWRMAADRGDMVSQYNLGIAYYNGLGVERDLVEATRWIRRSAEQDYETARELLPTLEERLRQTASTDTAVPADSPPTAAAPASQPAASGDGDAAGAPPTAAPRPATIDVDVTAAVTSGDNTEVFAAGAPGTPVIEKLPKDTPLTVAEQKNGWALVNAARGFRVWVYGTFVDGDGDNARIKGEKVRARPLPSTADQSTPIGSFRDGDRVSVIRSEGKWKYVQGPGHLGAWVKASSLRVLEQPTQAWADLWRAAGGTLE